MEIGHSVPWPPRLRAACWGRAALAVREERFAPLPAGAAAGVVRVEADGVDVELRGATVERAGQTVTIRLSPVR
ncbi:MAG: hypothetical protein ACYC2G_07170 [Gemmatimonadaceae bacterium]